LSTVVKVTIFIADWNDFAAFNNAYAEIFTEPFPARSTIQNTRPPRRTHRRRRDRNDPNSLSEEAPF